VFTPRQFILEQCFVAGNDEFCDFIERRPTQQGQNSPGSLAFVDAGPTNSGGLSTEGIDVTLSYRQNLENWGLAGDLNARVAYTHVFEGEAIPVIGAPADPFNRELGASRNKATGTLAYNLGDWGLTLRGTYTGPAYLDNQFTEIEAGDEGSDDFKVGSYFVADMQMRFTPGDNYEFYFGVDNFLDEDPPLIPTGLPYSIRGSGVETDTSVYDVIGRRFYAGARLRF
jgi:outer membrane receptor protein involved in Fe transport